MLFRKIGIIFIMYYFHVLITTVLNEGLLSFKMH
jgi:hypothetical protein